MNVSLVLSGAQLSAQGTVLLKDCPDVDMETIVTAQDCITTATNPDIVVYLEQTVLQWCKQVEQVLHCLL